MFGQWLEGLHKTLQVVTLLGAAAVCWSIWLNRNNFVFEKKSYCSPVQVIFAAMHWVQSWAILQRAASQELALEASRRLMHLVMEFFSRAHGWRSSLRIESH